MITELEKLEILEKEQKQKEFLKLSSIHNKMKKKRKSKLYYSRI